MTLKELYELLNNVKGFNGKVAYRCFPVGAAPKLPFICYLVRNSNNFKADSSVYLKRENVDIELYSKEKDTDSEEAIEAALEAVSVVWDKTESFIESEEVYLVTYTVTIK